jgi:hypothetical protein
MNWKHSEVVSVHTPVLLRCLARHDHEHDVEEGGNHTCCFKQYWYQLIARGSKIRCFPLLNRNYVVALILWKMWKVGAKPLASNYLP